MRRSRPGRRAGAALGTLVCGLLALVSASSEAEAQDLYHAYQRGQNVSPAYEGWLENEDGSFMMVFGYMNRNWEEELDVPVGDGNFISPGPMDQGQPTHFRPRRNRFVFMVPVPADFGDREVVWTLTTRGRTEHAYGTLGIDQKLDNIVIASETGALGIGVSNARTRANERPTITVEGPTEHRVRVGQPVTLVVSMEDDGLEAAIARSQRQAREREERMAELEGPPSLDRQQLRPPSRITVQKVVAHHVAWFVYRGVGEVSFDPPQVKTWEDTRTGANSPWAPLWTRPPVPEDGRWVTTVTFLEPGTYVLRARGDDGALYHDRDVTVVVAPIS